MFDFYPSDFGTQVLADTKYYWQNETNKCCVLVPDFSSDDNAPISIHFLKAGKETEFLCTDQSNPDVAFISPTARDVFIRTIAVERHNGKCIRPENPGKIMNSIFDLIDAKSWSFPRAKADTPYITAVQASLFESMFKDMVKAPDDGNCVYASISKAGTMLADRIDIKSDIIFDVQHYDTETNTQDDSLIQVTESKFVDVVGKTVIVIDDLISSGRTAKAVIRRLMDLGAAYIYYFALYRTISSQEVKLPVADNIVIKSYAPLSNAYWTYGRGFDLTDDDSRNLPDIYAATKHWDWETAEDVQKLINFFLLES